MAYTRFAIYYLPPAGGLAEFGARWLGWDVASGRVVAQPDLPAIAAATRSPRKYGFHGTLKPPFRLAPGRDLTGLQEAVAGLAARCAPAQAARLELLRLGSFLALVPEGEAPGIARVAATCVAELDGFRAPLTEAELARRRRARLTARQQEMLQRWGYPYVMQDFRFHLTLTGRLPKSEIATWQAALERHLPALPEPFALDAVALVGERADGCFELLQRYALTG